jgi:methylated-DNA-protein-cysteine methyltransferase-like protein
VSDSYARIYATVRKIPRGRVATYGQVATIAGLKGHARQVGYALHALKSSTGVPWQRVINAQGRISLRLTTGGLTQQMLLEQEGVVFDTGGRVSLKKFGWKRRK